MKKERVTKKDKELIEKMMDRIEGIPHMCENCRNLVTIDQDDWYCRVTDEIKQNTLIERDCPYWEETVYRVKIKRYGIPMDVDMKWSEWLRYQNKEKKRKKRLNWLEKKLKGKS